jgi:hypothetical protein
VYVMLWDSKEAPIILAIPLESFLLPVELDIVSQTATEPRFYFFR